MRCNALNNLDEVKHLFSVDGENLLNQHNLFVTLTELELAYAKWDLSDGIKWLVVFVARSGSGNG
jgi:hypothetical protein